MADLVRRTQLDEYKTALVNPKSAQQVLEIGGTAAKLHQILKGMQGYEEEYYKAFEVMIEAYRVMGIELRQMDKQAGARSHGVQAKDPALPTLNAATKHLAELAKQK